MLISLQKYKWFLIPYFIFFCVGLIILSFWNKETVHLWSCQHHSPALDVFFSWSTNIGDGLFVILIAIILLFYRMSDGLFILSTYSISAVIAQIIKHLVNAPRPLAFFHDELKLHVVHGVKLLMANSFPSGHSTSAFALFLTLSIIIRYNGLQIFFFICALLVAYSRVYLSQHFLMDILVGSAIGVGTTLIYLTYHLRIKETWLSKPIYTLWNKHNKTNTKQL